MHERPLLAIGEALMDMIPRERGCSFDAISAFSPVPGGAPANVCAAFAGLGGAARLITQLGDDPFGHRLCAALSACGVDMDCTAWSKTARTGLAFVSLESNGDRCFSFYRHPAADMLLTPEQLDPAWFSGAFALHFCSVSLGNFPMQSAHRAAIAFARDAGAILSFDPNLRPALWSDAAEMLQTVREFLPLAHLVKVSLEELQTLTEEADPKHGLPRLLCGDTRLAVCTCGDGGAYACTREHTVFVPAQSVPATDTTGAGDGFVAALLYTLQGLSATPDALAALSAQQLSDALTFANRFCAYSVQRPGAISSYPTRAALEALSASETERK